jgi:hypothetical protein
MSVRPDQIAIYHITDVENLASILAAGGLWSDVRMAQQQPATVIGYGHIKERRMKEITVPCCENRFVGEFVPFYFCPRSPMLYTLNRGNTGRPPGCQSSVVHLVSTVEVGISQGRAWAVSDGNAGAFHTSFDAKLDAIADLDWTAIRAINWQGRTHQKMAEFLVADIFPWTGIHHIGCHNATVAGQVKALLQNQARQPLVDVQPNWYY